MKRGVGIARVVKSTEEKQLEDKGRELNEENLKQVQESIEVFKKQLGLFAMKHKKQINQDSEFRMQFHIMCNKIGVDPLASTKGFWSGILGIGDFYYELGVQIVHISLSTRTRNGGLMDFQDLMKFLKSIRSKNNKSTTTTTTSSVMEVSEDDVKRAISKLQILGNGLRLVNVGQSRLMLVSVPVELSSDHTAILDVAQANGGFVSFDMMKQGWNEERFNRVVDTLLKEGMAWFDAVDKAYYFPSMRILSSSSSSS